MTRIRPASAADFIGLFGHPPNVTVRAIVVEGSTGVVALGGYYLIGDAAAVFSDILPGARKRDIVAGCRQVMDRLTKLGIPVVGKQGPDGDVILKHFGFVPLRADIWKWRGHD